MTHPILITFLISTFLTVCFYYYIKDKVDDEDDPVDNDSIYTKCISLFIIIFVILYLLISSYGEQITEFCSSNNQELDIPDRSNYDKAYKAPF